MFKGCCYGAWKSKTVEEFGLRRVGDASKVSPAGAGMGTTYPVHRLPHIVAIFPVFCSSCDLRELTALAPSLNYCLDTLLVATFNYYFISSSSFHVKDLRLFCNSVDDL